MSKMLGELRAPMNLMAPTSCAVGSMSVQHGRYMSQGVCVCANEGLRLCAVNYMCTQRGW